MINIPTQSNADYKAPKSLKMGAKILGAIALISGAADFWLENSFALHPRTANSQLDLTVPYQFKGAIVFITPDEFMWIRIIYYCIWTAGGALFILAIFLQVKRGYPAPGDPPRID